MKVQSITVYPVKATAGVPVDSAEVEVSGLRHDRRWAIVDLEGKRLNAERHDTLLRVTATPGDDGLTLAAEGCAPLSVPVPVDGPQIATNIARFAEAIDAGDAAAAWFSSYLDNHVRLIWQDDPAKRPIAESHGGLGDEPLSLADAGPLLLTSTTSLAQLNDWIGAGDLEMARFRPNVVVDGIGEAFAEDGWRRLRIGDVPYRFAEHCDRCVVTTIDPQTLQHGKEPIRTLAQRRKWDGKTWFGIRIVPLEPGKVSVGDAVTVDESR